MALKPPFDIKEIKPGTFSYFTRRKLNDKEGRESGEVLLWKKVNEEESHYIMICPYCKEKQEGSVILKKRPYRVRCKACKKSIILPKLLNEAKRKK